jgi:hypothetical protein
MGDPEAGEHDGPESPAKVQDLLERYRLRAHRMARAQYLAGKRAHSMHIGLGVPVVVLTAVVGTTIFSSLGASPDSALVIVAGLISLLAATLAALQTFLGFAERAEKHRTAAAAYSALKRDLDVLKTQFQITTPSPGEALAELHPLIQRFAVVEEESLDVADVHYDRARREEARDDEGV